MPLPSRCRTQPAACECLAAGHPLHVTPPPLARPQAPPELALPSLEGKTEKMYRGGKICLDSHFRPLWARNVPHFGIAHAMALGMGPWLAVEIPSLIANGKIKYEEPGAASKTDGE